LGNNKQDYLLARAIQFFAPGIPQVYYAGVLGLNNDMALLAKSQVGRDINRPYLDDATLQDALTTPFFGAMKTLIKLRNTHPAFNGEFTITLDGQMFNMQWQLAEEAICLNVDILQHTASITTFINNNIKQTIYIKDESIK
jgi:sucrose phosphorylase